MRKGRLFPAVPFGSKPSDDFRDDLRTAGIARTSLFSTDATRRQIRIYDLRATGITWCAVQGDAPQLIQASAGHAVFEMTLVYIREAAVICDGFGTVFHRCATRSSRRFARRLRNRLRFDWALSGRAGDSTNPRTEETLAEAAGVEPALRVTIRRKPCRFVSRS